MTAVVDQATRTQAHQGTGTPADQGIRIRALHREPQESQRDFTVLLDVLSRPGRVRRLDAPEFAPTAAVAACGLGDVEVPTLVLAEDGDLWAEAVHAATGAPRATAATARAVVALRPLTDEDVRSLPRGDALNPELGARIFARVESLAEGEHPADDALVLALTGPGVREENRLTVRGLSRDTVTALVEANSSFPLGVDTFLAARDGSVAGLPRTTRVRVVADGGA
jgi:alpha-D-ribose 1-methylphosphonate 5-triphosphate synthase subunit PhnH